MRRREFIALITGAVAAVPRGAAAQHRTSPVIAFLRAAPPPQRALDAFRDSLAEGGLVSGRNCELVFYFGDGTPNRFPQLAADIVRSGADLIVADSVTAARVLHKTTTTIPIVMAFGADPVRSGLAESLARPGGNVTGVTSQAIELSGKTFELLRWLLPQLSRVAVLDAPVGWDLFAAADAQAAQTLGLKLSYVNIGTADDVETVLNNTQATGAEGAVIRGTPWATDAQRHLIVEQVAKHRLPAVYQDREFVDAGGLISYGADRIDLYRRAAAFVTKILKGNEPGNLPIQQPTKFELVINLKTSNALGLTVPQSLLARANEVIE